MNPDELEQQLRTLLAEEGFAWILEQVDETIAAGKPEDVSVKKRTRPARRRGSGGSRHQTHTYSIGIQPTETNFLITPVASESPGSHIKTNTYTAAERASLILQAVRSVLVDIPKVHKEQLVLLSRESSASVSSVAFLPDENGRGEQTTVIAREGQPAPFLPESERIDQLLRALEEGLTH
ncbi:hypothetical protein [Nonomuraea roseoviolacea]|uniref:Uncharacterized protein n=1 Tax=Nonomuraea roseoviolacea subsp. carminata TaxID=160689 RepID=A0ABT1K3A6_9ACTN|nr:hypothetical protein [Nonomuraea roseoviolacea]MCP2348129.1 hypothetical protein [Nonomuraea roseoviolacea subsp. carminata]